MREYVLARSVNPTVRLSLRTSLPKSRFPNRNATPCTRFIVGIFIVLAFVVFDRAPATAQGRLPIDDALRRIYAGRAPKSAADLRLMQRHQRELAERVLAATVSVQVGNENNSGIAFGSGVIVSDDGLIMSAAHVASAPGRMASIRLSNGDILRAVSLGVHRPLDAGMLKITDDVQLPYLPVNRKDRAVRGQWCAAAGHPGGFDKERGPVFRIGRVLSVGSLLRTDCQLAGGDSGGPLVNMRGEVIGINSRIGISLANNLHTSARKFDRHWDDMIAGKVWSGPSFLGVRGDEAERRTIADRAGAVVEFIHEDSAAERAGIRIGDVITRFGGQRVHSFADLVSVVQLRRPGERVDVELLRDGEVTTLQVRIGRRPSTTQSPNDRS